MAMKVGTENKRNVIIVVVLFCILAIVAVVEFMGPSTPKPAQAPTPVPTPRQSPVTRPVQASVGGAAGSGAPDARKVGNAGLDPALHLEKLALSESIEYAGTGRNIFSENSAPIVIEDTSKSARNVTPAPPVNTGPIIPTPPAIDMHYFGYSANKEGKREAFLLHGDDIFEAAAGEIVNHRYKVVSVDARSVQITDLSYNNTQTLQLTAN
jgi:hypothetical protein